MLRSLGHRLNRSNFILQFSENRGKILQYEYDKTELSTILFKLTVDVFTVNTAHVRTSVSSLF